MNRKYLVAIGVGIVVLLVGGYYLFFAGKSSTQNSSSIVEQTVPTIPAAEIGLTLKPSSDGHKVIVTVGKTDDIASLDYELTYTSRGNIPRGVLGQLDFKRGQIATKEIYLGTCSNVCHPDSEVSDIKIVVKVGKTDGKVFQAQATTSL